jgi:NAD+ synthase (glutamine-hydrolysing)
MRYTIAQMDSVIGDFSANAKKIVTLAEQALQHEKPDLLLFPELALCGYPPLSLLNQSRFLQKNNDALDFLKKELPVDLAVGLGYITKNSECGKGLCNTYGIFYQGKIIFEQEKMFCSSYDFFDESKYFEATKTCSLFEFGGEKIGFAIGENFCKEKSSVKIDESNPLDELVKKGATLLCVPAASPFYLGKSESRIVLAKQFVAKENVPLIYINAVGANDSIIFDGASFVVSSSNNNSALAMITPSFEESLVTWDNNVPTKEVHVPQKSEIISPSNLSAQELDKLEAALILGIKSYMQKCGFAKAHLGLSGGIDSALALYFAVMAVGKDNVKTFGMPSHFSSEGSKDDARELAQNLDCHFEILPIAPMYNSFMESLSGVFENRPFDTTEENLQARIRGTLMMAYSNKFNSLLLTTGNKSEVAMGYCTLYGDMNGGLNPIGDLFKTEVFAMCKRINQRSIESGGSIIIPESIIDKPPSAELRPDQKDQDSLPPYEVLDEILRLYLYENLSKKEIVQRGWDEVIVTRVIKTTARSEFKRRQAAPILSVSKQPFGTNRKMPMARYLHEID